MEKEEIRKLKDKHLTETGTTAWCIVGFATDDEDAEGGERGAEGEG
jgi:hypothetical protein